MTNNIKVPLFNGETLEEQDAKWQRVEGGFSVTHKELHGSAGLFRAILNGEVMYIGCSAAPYGGRLYQRLRNFLGEPQTANSHYAALKIREHIDCLDLEVLITGRSWRDISGTLALRNAMVRLYQPDWNRAPRPRSGSRCTLTAAGIG